MRSLHKYADKQLGYAVTFVNSTEVTICDAFPRFKYITAHTEINRVEYETSAYIFSLGILTKNALSVSMHIFEDGDFLLHTLIVRKDGNLYWCVVGVQPHKRSVPTHYADQIDAPKSIRFVPPHSYWTSNRMHLYINRLYNAMSNGYDAVYFTKKEYNFMRARIDGVSDKYVIEHGDIMKVSCEMLRCVTTVLVEK